MGVGDVKGLHERLLGDLPVGLDDFADMRGQVALLQRPAAEMPGHVSQVVGQRVGVRVHVDKDKTVPGRHFGLGQAEFIVPDGRKIPAAGHAFEAAVQAPGKAVERTPKGLDTAALVAQPGAAM